MPSFQTIADPATLVDYMVDDYWPDQGTPNFRPPMGPGQTISVNLSGLDARGAAAARAAFAVWEMAADVDFREVSQGAAVTFTDNGDDAATVIRFSAGRQASAIEVNIGAGWLDRYGSEVGSFGFRTYVHEIGHVLGLGHTGDYNNEDVDWSRNHDPLDSYQYTVMSYFGQDENPNTGASRAAPITLQLADILAAQRIYGAPDDEVSAGDTVWGRNSTLDNYLGDYFRATYQLGQSPRYAATFTIRDTGGHDLLDFSHHGTDQEVNLVAGGISSVLGLRGNLILTPGTLIEDYNAGHGDDRINGNALANRLAAGGGDDTVWGNGGDDWIDGGVGNDTLRGGAGNEQLFGSYAHDALYGEGGRDRLAGGLGEDSLFGGAGGDRLFGDEGSDRLDGGGGGDLLEGGLQDDRLSGGGGRDTLDGGDGSDRLDGGGGRDRLDGGAAADRLGGGGGDDSLTGGEGGDTLAGGSGDDRLSGGEGLDLLRGEEGRDRLDGGEGNDGLDGGAGDDALLAGAGQDSLSGGAGRDRLEGGAGSDRLEGGAGADVFVFDGGRDAIADFGAGDRILLDAALWGGRPDRATVMADLEATAAGLELDINGQTRLLLEDVHDRGAFADAFGFL